MSAGLSFGALPAFADLSPDQQAAVMQSLQARASEQQQPGSPDQLLYNRAGMGGGQNGFQPPEDGGPTQTGAVGREAHQNAPMVAMDEAAVRRMEQPMLPPTAGGNVPPVPQAAPPQQGGPVPPAMPQPSIGGAQPAPQAAPQMPPMGAAPSTPGGQSNVSPTAAAQASGQAGAGGGMFDKFLSGLQNPQVSDLLLNLGIGLMSQRGIGQGLAAGLQGYQKASSGNLQQQLQQIKFMQEQKQQQDQRNYLIKSKGLTPEAADALIASPTLLANQLNSEKPNYQTVGGNIYDMSKNGGVPGQGNLIGPASGPPSGYQPGPDGGLSATPGGPEDIARKAAEAAAIQRAKNAESPDKPIQVRPGGVLVDPNTHQPLYTAPSGKPEGFDQEEKLRTDFTKQQSSFQTVHNAYGSIVAATQDRQNNPGKVSPAADMSLIFGYMKMLDPGSVVREGEYATAQNATGVPDRVLNSYNKLINGESLNDEQRRDFLDQAQKLYGQQRKNAEGLQDHYKGLAKQYGLEPERVARLPDAPQAPAIPDRNAAVPNEAAIKALQGNSHMRDQFDAKFGRGASARYLGGQ